ncbi:hypothetical protein [Bdellovibrio sp. BCCA]|uniref:hypothetical protein n=1 Tax=Bdellovibrio sp. BCCA TaxID=3136281 RepID=UPI0030F2772B
MKSVAIALFVSVLSVASSSLAARGYYLYEANFNHMGKSYLDRLESMPTDQLSSLSPEKRNICIQRYKGILEDGVLDIRIALGYFDWTTGSNVYADGRSFGVSPSMDIGAFYAIKSLLLSSCEGRVRLCGFSQDPKNNYRFLKTVQIQGNKYTARVEVQFASATEYLSQNLGDYREQQRQRTQYMDNYFAHALQEADAVFYFGHSRNGGGPDFAPPIFIPGRNKVNYDGYYEVQRPGLKKMLAALNASDKKTAVLGLMSCASRDHFLRKVRAAAPQTGVITSMDVLNVDEVYTAMLGGIDALLRGQCQQSFYQQLRMTSNNQKYITMDGMFE